MNITSPQTFLTPLGSVHHRCPWNASVCGGGLGRCVQRGPASAPCLKWRTPVNAMSSLGDGRHVTSLLPCQSRMQTWTAGSGAAPSQATSGFFPGTISCPVWRRTEMWMEDCPPLGPLGVQHLMASLASLSPSRHCWKSAAKFQLGGEEPLCLGWPPASCTVQVLH